MKWLRYLFIILGLAGCNARQTTASQELTVFAAASLTDAFDELAAAFQAQNQGVTVLFNYGGSSQLAAQLAEGAVADLFASANAMQMANVIRAGRVEAGAERIFVSNRLAVVVPAANPADIHAFEDLGRPGLLLILAVEGVPVRDYTDEVVATMPAAFQQQFYDNLVSEEENVRQVVAKVALGEADAGIVYSSDVTPDIAGQLQQIVIPDAQNVVATYPIAPIAGAPHPQLAQRFIDFVLSAEGQAILMRWGFGPPPGH